MSASREKKTRQQNAGELTEKQRKALKEASAAKRNGVIFTVVGVVCALLAAALLVWNSGIFQGRAKALTVDGESYTATDVQYYFSQAYSNYYMYARYGMDTQGLDINLPLKDQMYDEENGVTWHDHIMDEAIDTIKEITAANKAAREAGYTLSEEGKQSVKSNMQSLVNTSASNGFSSVGSYLKAAYGKGMTKGRLRAILERNMLAQEFEQKHTDELTYTDDQLETYYKENADTMDLFRYDYVTVNAAPEERTDSAGNAAEPTEEEKAKAHAEGEEKANAVAEALREGKGSEELTADYGEDAKVSLYFDREDEGAYLTSVLAGWLRESARTAGEVTVIEDEDSSTYYVARYTGRGRNEEVSADIRHILVAAEQDEGATEPTQAQYDAAKAEAEQLLAEWKAGEATEDSFAKLAQDKSADPGSASNGGLYERVSSSTGFIQEFTDWALDPARKPGDTGLVQNTGSSTKGWHIMYYVKPNDEAWQLDAAAALRNEDTEKWVEELTGNMEVQKLDGLNAVK